MKLVPLVDCCEIVSGATPKTNVRDYWDGDIAWATPADLSHLDGPFIEDTPRRITAAGLASCAATVMPPGSVLLSSRAPIGHVAINRRPMATNQGFKSLIPRDGLADAKYLYHWLRANRSYLQSLGNGATFKEVSKAVVAGVEVPLPPLDEQRRVATILDRADELRAKRREALDHLDILERSIFRVMFGDVVSNDRRWAVEALGAVASTTSGGTPSRNARANYGGSIPWVKSGELHNNTVTTTEEALTGQGLLASAAKLTPPGTVLVAMYGATAGVVSVLGIEAATNQAICSITPGPLLDRTYVVATLRAMNTSLLRRRSGGAQPNLSQAILRSLPIPVPPMLLQRAFAERVKHLDAIRGRMANNRIDSLRDSLSDRAFRGQL